jgi:hypothetical protein
VRRLAARNGGQAGWARAFSCPERRSLMRSRRGNARLLRDVHMRAEREMRAGLPRSITAPVSASPWISKSGGGTSSASAPKPLALRRNLAQITVDMA